MTDVPGDQMTGVPREGDINKFPRGPNDRLSQGDHMTGVQWNTKKSFPGD